MMLQPHILIILVTCIVVRSYPDENRVVLEYKLYVYSCEDDSQSLEDSIDSVVTVTVEDELDEDIGDITTTGKYISH